MQTFFLACNIVVAAAGVLTADFSTILVATIGICLACLIAE